VLSRASDVHLEPADGGLRVRYRIDGALHEVMHVPVPTGEALLAQVKALAGMDPGVRRRWQHGRIRCEVEGRPLDVRVATSAIVSGEKTVLHLLDRSRGPYRLGELGMPDETSRVFARVLGSPYGLVVAAGPAGSGRTATLYAALGEVDSPSGTS
jgi:type IV pilus assembly protein PilB